MTDYLVAEFLNSVDGVISLPIQQTQRIKYTAYDVSETYVVFGASSGGLYIFNRHPCSFIKLIPSTEGSVVNLSISIDEKIIAVGTSRGTLCLFNNDDMVSRNVQVFNEHQGNKITAMKWHQNGGELYCGDNTGKISVVVTNFITKTVFQTPCATLMQLDSSIVQLDWGSRFLLVSTLTRCYLCDTESEHYRQIGKKLRDGEYGACFFGTKLSYTIPFERKIEIGSFSILNDKESFVTYDDLENIKMFCARPGARIWEVQLNGTVIRTHQFREALAKGSNHVIALDNKSECRLNFQISPKKDSSLNTCNFMKMSIFNNNFILTYQRNGIYILDPQNVAVVFWTDLYTDIIDVKVVKKFIYLWTSKNQMHVLLFSTLENFIIKSLLNKMYLLCTDLCILYQSQIKKILPMSSKLYLLSSLNEKLTEMENSDLLEQIQPILTMIKEFTSNRQTAQKLSSGIFIVDNAHFVNSVTDNNTNQEIVNSTIEKDIVCTTVEKDLPTNIYNNPKDCIIQEDSSQLICDNFSGQVKNPIEQVNNKTFELLYEEYELNKINTHFRTTIIETAFGNSESLNEITETFLNFVKYFDQISSEQCDINLWCYETCLKFLEKHLNKFSSNAIETNSYLRKAFEKINSCTQNSCTCQYPLPNASLVKPKFYDIGYIITKHCWKETCYEDLCNQVPYMWKDIIKLRENEDISSLLPLIIQYGDMATLSYFVNKFTYDLWSEILTKCIFLKSGRCLNCEQEFQIVDNLGFSWNDLATEMIKTIGAESTVCLLLENADSIPKAELDIDFYQSCIFSTMVDNLDTKLRQTAVQFVKDGNALDENFGKLLEKTLQNREFTNLNYSANVGTNKCSYCSMPLRTPVLCKEKLVGLKCGHYFHNICIKRHNNICNICSG